MPTDEEKEQNGTSQISTLESALKNNPNDVELSVELGMAYFHTDQLDDAMAAFQRAIELNPNAAGAHNWIGRVYERRGSVQAAMNAFDHAIALDPDGVAPYVGKGILYLDQHVDYEAAIEAFQTGVEKHPEDAFAVALLGITYARVERFPEATTSLQKAITLQPDNTFAYGNLSIIYLYLKQYDDMIATCHREIAIEDGHDARRLLGFAYDRLGRYDEAIHHLERSITLDPQDYEARGALARVYRTVERHQEADEQHAIAWELAKKDNEYGQACFESVSGNVDRALTLLEVALTKGQVQPGWARIDPEFAFMDDDPRFKALIA